MEDRTNKKQFWIAANRIVMGIAAFLLILAGVLKTHQLLTEPILTEGEGLWKYWESWEFFVIQIPLEFGLGIWLICGIFRKAGWLLATLSFAGFIGVTLFKALSGAESCGCFGLVKVNPWITLLAMDIPMLVLLLICRPVGEKLLPPPWPKFDHIFGVAVPTFLLLGFVTAILILYKPAMKNDKFEVLDPNEWATANPIDTQTQTSTTSVSQVQTQTQTQTETQTNTQSETDTQTQTQTAQPPKQLWPLLDAIDIADQLQQGLVVALLYHYDCPDCSEAIPIYEEYAQQMGGQMQFAFINAPVGKAGYYGPTDEDPVPEDTTALRGKLDGGKMWYFSTPLVVLLVDGEVVETWQDIAPDLDEILAALE